VIDAIVTVISQPAVIDTKITQPAVISTTVNQPAQVSTVLNQPSVLETVITPPAVINTVLTVGQGPAGSQGLPGTSGSTVFTKVSANALSGHRVISIDAIGALSYASNANLIDAMRVVGITTGAVMPGNQASIITFGELEEPSWNWVTALPVYLGLDGYLTQIVPSALNALFSLVLGFPITATKLFVNIGNPIILTT
jgi:hypothetical protein